MSVNYGHAVDVPVTDMDDSDDDIVFNEQSTATNPITAPHVTFADDLNALDYEYTEQDRRQGVSGFFSSIASLADIFKKKRTSSAYEMVDRSSDSFELDREEDEQDANSDFRDYKLSLLHKKMRRTIVLSVMIITGLISFIIYLFKRGHGIVNGFSNPHQKQVLNNSTHSFYPTTILVSLDGFHPHYISPKVTPTMHNMLVRDFGAPYMIPSFPSSTFPNHWTLITGLYPSEHGIVGNTFYDPELKKQFINTNPSVGGLDPDFWRGGEPIWETATRQGVKSAVHMWPGSEVPEIGPLEDFDRFNASELLSVKVDRVMGWLDRSDINDRPELVLTYVPTIDQFGHKYGISGDDLSGALTYVDNFVMLMQQELKSRNLQDIVNLVIVSDHGMAPTSKKRLLYLDDLIDISKIEHIDGWPLFGLRPRVEHSVDEIYEELDKKLQKAKNFKVYKLADLPKEWQFGGDFHKYNYRLAPIWIIPQVGYSITTHKQMDDNNGEYKPKGVHGYNNTELLMRAIFLGTGPYFQKKLADNTKIKPFQNTEVYSLVCESLNITPAPNNSTGQVVSIENVLPDGWSDSTGYPDLPFAVEHIVQDDATYDLLYRKKKKIDPWATQTTVSVTLNDDPKASMSTDETSTIETEQLPRPTDFEEPEDEKQDDSNEDVQEGDAPEDYEEDDGADGVDEIVGDIINDVGSVIDDVGSAIDDAASTIADKFKVGVSGIKGWIGGLFGGGKDEK